MTISFTTIVLDEIDHLHVLMPMLSKVVDQIVMVDTGSSDGSAEYLKSGGATLLHSDIAQGFSRARNIGLLSCTSPWVLSLDCDERPSEGLLEWIVDFVKSETHAAGVRIRRITTIDGQTIADESFIRLFRRTLGKWSGDIHESVSVGGPVVDCPAELYILHDKTSAMQIIDNAIYLQFYPKLNLGSGGKPMPADEGWVNFDIDPDHAPGSVYADVFDSLPGLPASHILASHVLEHASYHKASKALGMWIAKLAPGGTIEVRVPDAESIMRAYVSGRIHYLRLLQLMFGGQSTQYDYHNICIDESWLRGQLLWNKLTNVQRVEGGEHELVMTARKPIQ